MYGEATEVLRPTPQPSSGLHTEVTTACERMGKLIAVHNDILRRLRGAQPEPANRKETRAPESVADFVAILHQQLTELENQTGAFASAIG